ncbi:GLPGLI family protein [Elizabethkingia anophelis]|nr:GLPGLI family protein [Elizabethkingia anophelis]MCT3952527.1 GLPGLI family protein [Elizabethkingia anophelis]MCT3956227.1 GLPGLI family protein [Elizabethkingia anophelis]MCT3987760.1 GLPGLI family protein [Elizabethkingia anophelis]MCT4066354.1 GLPGLI family protein [Elizabethkingia anophelis]
MKTSLFQIILIFYCFSTSAQQVHVKYSYIRSPVAVLYEDLYINNGKVISIQDSVISRPVDSNSGWLTNVSVIPSGTAVKIVQKSSFISSLSADFPRKFFFNSAPYSLKNQTVYFISDEVPKPIWLIKEKETKKIAGYTCIKATTIFRGSNITAYFTKELPYSAGPFKFFGLPGLILDVRVDNKPYMIWKAEQVTLNDKTKVNYNPKFPNFPRITMKEFVKLNDELTNNFNTELRKNLPQGVKNENISKRANVETIFEWE